MRHLTFMHPTSLPFRGVVSRLSPRCLWKCRPPLFRHHSPLAVIQTPQHDELSPALQPQLPPRTFLSSQHHLRLADLPLPLPSNLVLILPIFSAIPPAWPSFSTLPSRNHRRFIQRLSPPTSGPSTRKYFESPVLLRHLYALHVLLPMMLLCFTVHYRVCSVSSSSSVRQSSPLMTVLFICLLTLGRKLVTSAHLSKLLSNFSSTEWPLTNKKELP